MLFGSPEERVAVDILRIENVPQRSNATSPNATTTAAAAATLQADPARPNDHNRTLSHVVMPFHEKQIDRVRTNLQLWETYPPCNTNPLHNTAKTARPTLVFHIAYSVKDDQPSDIEEVEQQCMQAFESLSDAVKSCFLTAYALMMQLSHYKDSHTLGARLAFEEFLQGKVTSANNETSSYALYMEPDMVPIRENWLMHVITQVEWPIPEFWIKGSIFRGSEIYMVHPGDYKAGMMHLNGNALYNLASDDFRNFYFKKLRPYIRRKYKNHSRGAYDTDFYDYLDYTVNYPVSREIFHFFQYTDLIQNHYRSPWSAKQLAAKFPNTVLVHGGNNTDNYKSSEE